MTTHAMRIWEMRSHVVMEMPKISLTDSGSGSVLSAVGMWSGDGGVLIVIICIDKNGTVD